MVRPYSGLCAVCLALALFASSGSAATIAEVLAAQFDPTNTAFQTAGYGSSGFMLAWSNIGSNGLFGPGAPTPNFTAGPSGGNPSWLNFQNVSQNTSTGSGTTSTTGSGSYSSLYKLGTNTTGSWEMDFSVLLFDPNFTGTSLTVELQGSKSGTQNFVAQEESAAAVKAGVMLTFSIQAADGETVSVLTTSNGGTTSPAGFFMDNAAGPAVPEPATLALLGLGLGATVWRRKK